MDTLIIHELEIVGRYVDKDCHAVLRAFEQVMAINVDGGRALLKNEHEGRAGLATASPQCHLFTNKVSFGSGSNWI